MSKRKKLPKGEPYAAGDHIWVGTKWQEERGEEVAMITLDLGQDEKEFLLRAPKALGDVMNRSHPTSDPEDVNGIVKIPELFRFPTIVTGDLTHIAFPTSVVRKLAEIVEGDEIAALAALALLRIQVTVEYGCQCPECRVPIPEIASQKYLKNDH